ncbi:MAG TPA: NAD(P)/FAD-dependent oxidoreductase [Anaerolineae bacterium]|nr:NAD(P)/FAD-dependent oxidoreductase [Anaerolineae bacterium]
MSTSPTRIGIIGGGYAGLTAAYELQKLGYAVTVLEKYGTWGGQAATVPLLGTRIEYFYHHLFGSDTYALDLMEELGLGDRLRWIESKVGWYDQGRIYDLVTPLDLLRFRPLSLVNRLKLGLMYLYLPRVDDWRRLEQVTARDWILRYLGRDIYDKFWGPLLRGKFGEMADQVSMTWLWGKIKVRGTSRQGASAKEKLAYPQGSFEIITQALVERLRAGGADLRLNREVIGLTTDPDDPRRVTGVITKKETIPFDAVIATVPGYNLLEIAPPALEGPYADRLRSVRYQAALVLLLVSKRSLSRIYWLNIADRTMPYVGVIEHTNYVPPAEYQGRRLIYVSNYLERDDPRFRMTADELFDLYRPHLKRINPQFDADWIEKKLLFRAEAGQPVITCGYSERIPDHRTPLPGLYLANTLQIYPEDRGVNYSVRLGQTISRIVAEDLGRPVTRGV